MQLPGPRVDAGSQGSGDDGEGQDGAAGLQLQGGDETLGGSGGVALSLQDLAQAVPHVVSRAEDGRGHVAEICLEWLTHTNTHTPTC